MRIALVSWARSPHVIFVFVALAAGLAFLRLSPPLWGLDEPAHFARVWHILQGQFVTTADRDDPANAMPTSFVRLYDYRTQDILDGGQTVGSPFNRRDVTNEARYTTLTSKPFSESESYFPYTANYSPIAYPGPLIGVAVARGLHLDIGATLALARILSLLSYVGIGAFAIWIVRHLKLRWLFFLAALTPTAVFQASVITADTLLIGGALLYVALLLRAFLDEAPSRGIVIGLGVVSVLLPLVKINFLLLVLVSSLIPSRALLRRRDSLLFRVGVPVLAAAVSLGWTALTPVTASPQFSQRPDQLPVSPAGQISYVLHDPLHGIIAIVRSLLSYGDGYYQQSLFTVAGNAVQTPQVVTIAVSIALVLAGLLARSELKAAPRAVIALGVASVIVALTVFASLYVGFSPVGWPFVDGVQGRYFLPLLIPAAGAVAWLIPADVTIRDGARARGWTILMASVSVAALLVSLVWVWLADY